MSRTAQHLRQTTLRTDIDAAVATRQDLTVAYQQPGSVVTGCTIGGAYLRRKGTDLPRIVIARSTRIRGERFTLGHELIHHFVDNDPSLADLLFREPGHGHALEEDICDSGAAYLLVRGRHVDAALGTPDRHHGVTAHAVAALHELSQGSVEVCSVTMSTRMTMPGHVLVCDLDPPADTAQATVHIRFYARGPGAERRPLADAQQDELFAVARRAGVAAGPVQLRSPSGAVVARHVDIAVVADALVCVLAPPGRVVDRSPAANSLRPCLSALAASVSGFSQSLPETRR